MSTAADTTFRAVLRRLRLAAGLSQGALAERAGLSERAVSDLERDPRRTPRLETVTLLADALSLPPGDRAQLLVAARPETAAPHEASIHALVGVSVQPEASAYANRDTTEPQPQLARQPRFTALPAAPNQFVGRARDVAALGALLRRSDVRMLTLTGPGGIGKTRLALRAAMEPPAFAAAWAADRALPVEAAVAEALHERR